MPDLSDTPAASIKRLDDGLVRRGKNVVLKRKINGTAATVDLTVRARMTGYQIDNLVSGVKVTDSKFIMSPTQIVAAGTWPGEAGGRPWPTIGDILVEDGQPRRIEQCLPMSQDGVVTRIEGRVS